MTPQEIFNTVAEHLFQQGWRAECNNHVYTHHPDGRKCPVGILIEEDPEFEKLNQNIQIRALVEQHPERFPEYFQDKEVIGLLGYLQSIHDKAFSWTNTETMKKALTKAAEIYKLDASILDKLAFADDRDVPKEQVLTIEELEKELAREKQREKESQTTGAPVR